MTISCTLNVGQKCLPKNSMDKKFGTRRIEYKELFFWGGINSFFTNLEMRIIFVKSVNIRIKFQNLGGILGIGDIGQPP